MTDGTAPIDIHAMPGHLIRRLHQISVSVVQARLREVGVDLTPVQFAALSAIAAEPGMDQSTLAGRIAYDRATIGGVIDRLDRKGLIARTVSARDRRARELRPTDDGRAVLARIAPVVAEAQGEILAGLSEAERARFVELSLKVAEAANQPGRAPVARATASDESPHR